MLGTILASVWVVRSQTNLGMKVEASETVSCMHGCLLAAAPVRFCHFEVEPLLLLLSVLVHLKF